ncbi:hypothetical protein ACIQVU_19245 [Lysinibacillus sp. NPDC098008]|uniref:hypothetical protein n=1 Tax=Lysinibacillus sp. NPDC098008 TaxID=3364146 RepID=UPI0038197429
MVELGVPREHIELMKDYKMHSPSQYYPYYEEQPVPEKNEIISTKKIKGIDTGWNTSGHSIYDLFFSVTGEVKLGGEGGIHADRIIENFKSLQKNGLKYQCDFYANENPKEFLRDGLPEFRYLLEDDIYFSGATHRTISALMFNAPQMVGKVRIYKKNHEKYENWLLSKENQKLWEEILKKELINLFIKVESDMLKNTVLGLEIYTEKTRIFLGEVRMEVRINPSGDMLSDKEYFLDEKSRLKFLIEKLEELDGLIGKVYSETKLPFLYRMFLKYNLKFFYNVKSLFKENEHHFIDIRSSRDEIEKSLRKIFQKQLITKGSYEINGRNKK